MQVHIVDTHVMLRGVRKLPKPLYLQGVPLVLAAGHNSFLKRLALNNYENGPMGHQGSRASEFGFQIAGFGALVSCFGFRVSGFGFWGFDFRTTSCVRVSLT